VKQLLPAAFMAIVIHGILFIVEVPWANRAPVKPAGLKTINFLLTREIEEEKPAPAPPAATLSAPSVPSEPERRQTPFPNRPEKSAPKRTEEKRNVPVKKEIPAPPPVVEASPTLPDKGVTETLSAALDAPPVREQKVGTSISTVETSPASHEGASTASLGSGNPNPGISASATAGGTISGARPLYKNNPRPAYPEIARKRNFQGTAVILALVNEKGSVEEARVETSSGHALLDNAAITAVKSWEFEPGRRGGNPVKSYVKLPITFELK
jgi:periplasmic protein TonB